MGERRSTLRYASKCGSVTPLPPSGERGYWRCCDSGPLPVAFGPGLYGDAERDESPAAVAASLGCGNPLVVAELAEGETVLHSGPAAGST